MRSFSFAKNIYFIIAAVIRYKRRCKIDAESRIIGMIGEDKRVRAGVRMDSHLYFDMGYDSISFINLIVKIEERYGITIGIAEMDECLVAGRLISIVKRKITAKNG